MRLDVPPEFEFRRTVLSHGWCGLPPFSLDEETWTLHRGAWKVRWSDPQHAIEVTGTRRKGDLAVLAHCLRLDEDLSVFYAMCADDPVLAWVPGAGAGRLLRCPTVFEDLMKLVTTTNCSWSLTERMVHGLVEVIGGGEFPTAAQVADAGLPTVSTLSTGYRAPAIVSIARSIAEGEIDPQRWLDPGFDPAALHKEILALPGCGPYVAENLARLVGHYEGLALDAWVRKKLAGIVGNPLTDGQTAARYERFGRYRGLALWCEVTADWLDTEGGGIGW